MNFEAFFSITIIALTALCSLRFEFSVIYVGFLLSFLLIMVYPVFSMLCLFCKVSSFVMLTVSMLCVFCVVSASVVMLYVAFVQ